mgnify:CR=1 FL=1
MVRVNALRQWCSRSCGHINALISSPAFVLSVQIFVENKPHEVQGSLILESFRSENAREDEYEIEFAGGCHFGNQFG